MSGYQIRLWGDPVLTRRSAEVTELDGQLARLADGMLETLHDANGLGLAAPQVGVQKRLFVYQMGEEAEARTIVNPTIVESRGEWEYDEGCLSIPGLYFPILRPKEVHLVGTDIDGNEVSIEADDLEARCFQHEMDHLDGVLLLSRLDSDQRKEAMRELRLRAETAGGGVGAPPSGGGRGWGPRRGGEAASDPEV